MVFISKKDNARKRRVERKIFRETGRRVGFVTTIGGGGGGRTITGGSGPSPSDPLFGKIGAGAGQETQPGVLGVRGRGNDLTGIAQPISVPRTSRTGTRRELQLSEGKKGDLFCEIKIIKGKRKRVCKVKTTDKKRKKPIRVSRNVDKQFGFFRRIL
jgi:hypothetical protein